jgi:hypothetical protein
VKATAFGRTQPASVRAYDYEMPPVLVSCLVHRSTWELFCPACRRDTCPNVIDLITRFGDVSDSDVVLRRAVCRHCGGL